ncbi:MAG: hypothetical protein KA764_04590 [Anaerolineales bacterium]|nr:hypothetical protein [Anaerolineales bacterium]
MTLTRETDLSSPAADTPRLGLSVEAALYLGLFGLALWLRLDGLGAAPLNDPEARAALDVWRFVRGAPEAGLPASPLYFFFTAVAFLVLPASDALARLAPALAGAGLTWLPWFFRRELGRGPALLTGGLLAVSSTLLAAARSADGATLVLLTFGVALGCLRRYQAGGSARWLIGAAAALGAALAGGRDGLIGLLLLGLVAGVAARSRRAADEAGPALRTAVAAERWAVLTALALSLILVATFGLTYRSGLAAVGAGWLNALTGFGLAAAGRSPFVVPVFLTAYEPLILVFGLAGAVRAFRTGQAAGRVLAGAALLGLIFTLLYSGRELRDAAWVVIPLTALAAQALLASVDAPREEWLQAGALAGLLLALLVFAGLNLARYFDQVTLNAAAWPPTFSTAPSFWLALMTLVVAGLITFLFGVTWSPRAAQLGLRLAGAAALLAVTVSAGWGLTQWRAAEPAEVWWPRPTALDVRRLVATLQAVSNFSVGQETEIAVTVAASPDGALAWALREFPQAAFTPSLDASIDSPVVIAPAGEQNPALGSAYVGQGFTVYRQWRPENLFTHEQVLWFFTRQAPDEAELYILWVRQDIQQPRTVIQP